MKYVSTVTFDPNNREHRQDYFRSLKHRGFRQCQNRYNLEGLYGDVFSMMTDRVVRYYVMKEFAKGSNETSTGQ